MRRGSAGLFRLAGEFWIGLFNPIPVVAGLASAAFAAAIAVRVDVAFPRAVAFGCPEFLFHISTPFIEALFSTSCLDPYIIIGYEAVPASMARPRRTECPSVCGFQA